MDTLLSVKLSKKQHFYHVSLIASSEILMKRQAESDRSDYIYIYIYIYKYIYIYNHFYHFPLASIIIYIYIYIYIYI